MFTEPVNGQYLELNNHLANVKSKINNIRFGSHSDKTRMVIDLRNPTNLAYEISSNSKMIRLKLPTATWEKTKASPSNKSINNIINFKHTATPTGSLITLLSDTPITIKRPFFLSPQGNHGHRLVIDIIPAKLGKNHQSRQTMVASLDNLGALPKVNSEVAQLRRSQNPYIQRAFPQQNQKQQKITPVPEPFKRSKPIIQPKSGNNPQIQHRYKQPYQSNGHEAQTGILGLNNSYIKGSVGMQLLDEISNDGNGTYDQEWDPGFILSGAIGTKLEDGFRVEGEFLYANSSLKQVSGVWNGSVYNTEKVQGDISSLAIMGNVLYDFQSNSKLSPYGMAGLGMALLSLNDLKAKNSAMANDMDVVAALQLGAGFTFDLDRRTKIELGYRYFETQNPEFSDSTGTPYESVFASHKFLLGARVEMN